MKRKIKRWRQRQLTRRRRVQAIEAVRRCGADVLRHEIFLGECLAVGGFDNAYQKQMRRHARRALTIFDESEGGKP